MIRLCGCIAGASARRLDRSFDSHPLSGYIVVLDIGEIPMRKQIIQYTSPIDALIAVTKRLSTYESRQQMDSEEFFDQYSRGQLSDDIVFVEWANDYRHYLELRQKLEKILPDVA